jgi:hypothetical protein
MEDFHGGLIHYGYKKYLADGAMAVMRSMKKYEVGILVNQQGSRIASPDSYEPWQFYVRRGPTTAERCMRARIPNEVSPCNSMRRSVA